MPEQPTTILAILNGSAALVGLYVTYRAYQGYRRSRAPFMLVLAVALGTLTSALVVEGFAFEILGWPLARAHVAEAAFNLVAFLIFAWSLHAPGTTRQEEVEADPSPAEDRDDG